MKNYKTFSSFTFIVLFFCSCQKPLEDLTTTPGTSASRVKTYTEDLTTSAGHTATTFNLSYDANGRLISMVSTSNAGDKFLYQYAGNTITLDLYNSNVLSIHEIFFLNTDSFIDSTFQYNDTKDTSTEKYTYNSNKQLMILKQYDYTTATGAVLWESTSYSYDAGGNLLKETNSAGVKSYEYSSLLNNVSIGFDFLPRIKYLPNKTTYVSGGSTLILNHTYTFDSSNRLMTEKVVANSGEILIKKYTY